jgi:hypothetical protein
MDARRFDAWTRNLSLRLNRRDALRLMGAGSAAAALSEFDSDALAQSTYTLTIHAETSGGPSAPAVYDGTLQLTLDADGTFTQASFTSSTGGSQPASGRATGRAIDIEVTLQGDRTLVLSGVSEQPVAECQGAMAGILSGPQPGDLGAWQATTGGAPAGALVLGSGQSSTGTSQGSTCTAPGVPCGQNCCPAGATCTDTAQGLCACPTGTEQCGPNCVPACIDGQLLDLESCTCPPAEAACIQNQQSCQNHGQCCSGYCGGGTCFDCAGKVCGDFGCIDPSRDNLNCGNCGNTCIAPQVCNNGVCGCAPDSTFCASNSECCSQLCFGGTCATCSNIQGGQGPLVMCGSECVDLSASFDHCGACFKACNGSGMSCYKSVCYDLSNDPNNCGSYTRRCNVGETCYLGVCILG